MHHDDNEPHIHGEVMFHNLKGEGVHSDTCTNLVDGVIPEEMRKFYHDQLDEYLDQLPNNPSESLFYLGNIMLGVDLDTKEIGMIRRALLARSNFYMGRATNLDDHTRHNHKMSIEYLVFSRKMADMAKNLPA